MSKLKKRPILSCTVIFAVCAVVRIIEYFCIRTDETALSENYIHKALGIMLLSVILSASKTKDADIGFTHEGALKKICGGLLLGTACFVIAYAIECLLLFLINGDVHLSFYASGFSLSNTMQHQTGWIPVLMCIVLNLINVFMEEGVFRGLFTKILEDISFRKSILIIAFLFGIWHLVMPLRDFIDGNSSFANLLIMGIGYVILAGVMSIKWSLLYQMTGSLWTGLGDHLFNNVIVTNLLHVVSKGEADSLQIVRILIGQLLSFGLVLALYRKRKKGEMYEKREESAQPD